MEFFWVVLTVTFSSLWLSRTGIFFSSLEMIFLFYRDSPYHGIPFKWPASHIHPFPWSASHIHPFLGLPVTWPSFFTWPVCHMTFLLLGLPVTWSSFYMACLSNDLSFTWPSCHMTFLSRSMPVITWPVITWPACHMIFLLHGLPATCPSLDVTCLTHD